MDILFPAEGKNVETTDHKLRDPQTVDNWELREFLVEYRNR